MSTKRNDVPDTAGEVLDGQAILEAALSEIEGGAAALLAIGANSDANEDNLTLAADYLGARLHEHYEQAMDGYRRLCGLDQYRREPGEEGTRPTSAAAGAATDAAWATLHRRWAELSAQIEALESEIDERQVKRRGSKKKIERLRADHDDLVEARDPVLSAIYDRPVTTFEAIAVLLDVAIEHGDITPPLELAAGWDTMNKVLKALRRFSPAIEFSALRRFYPPDVDVETIIADA